MCPQFHQITHSDNLMDRVGDVVKLAPFDANALNLYGDNYKTVLFD
jgi:hypothetical protein